VRPHVPRLVPTEWLRQVVHPSHLTVTHYPTSHAITHSSGNVSRHTHAPKTSSAFDIPHSPRRVSRVSGWPSCWGNVSHPQGAYLKRAWIRPRVGLMVNNNFSDVIAFAFYWTRFCLFSVASLGLSGLSLVTVSRNSAYSPMT
jgi:hypothetical protein